MKEVKLLIELKKKLKEEIENKNSWGKNELSKVIDSIVDEIILAE